MKKMLVGFLMDGHTGGVDMYLMNFLRMMHSKDLQIDFLSNEKDPKLVEELKEYHAKLYAIPTLRHPMGQYKKVCQIIKKNEYDMVYLNISTSMDLIAAIAAKKCKVPRVLLHSHSSGNDIEDTRKRKIFDLLQAICRPILFHMGTEYYACSRKAGYWMYPEHVVRSNHFQVIYNAVDKEMFEYNEEVRDLKRKELGLEDKFVIGHVAAFVYQKNHEYLIDVFEAYVKKQEAVLLLVGSGEKEERIRELVKEKGLENHVRFLGQRSDVNELMQAMDLFVLPSNFEGMPIVSIEAQCAGLPCIFSNTITEEAVITMNCTYLPITESAIPRWCRQMERYRKLPRTVGAFITEENRYSLESQKEQLQDMIDGRLIQS